MVVKGLITTDVNLANHSGTMHCKRAKPGLIIDKVTNFVSQIYQGRAIMFLRLTDTMQKCEWVI